MALLIRYQKNIDPSTFGKLLEERGIKKWIYLGTDTGWRIGAERSIRIPRESIANEIDVVARKYHKASRGLYITSM
jgi:hypothetical protein